MKIKLERVHHIPQMLDGGILYVSEEFEIAMHLCPCGCGTKVSTPLGPTDWKLTDTPIGPSLYPSVGNWQRPCQSHYWISGGAVIWAEKWTQTQILDGRRKEQERSLAYYAELDQERNRLPKRLWRWLARLFQ
jgi:hypothetical protein